MGLLSSTGPGSVTRMHRRRVVSGDGVVLKSLYNTSPGDRFVDRDTGEVWFPRADPDARRYPEKNPDRASPAKRRRPRPGSDDVARALARLSSDIELWGDGGKPCLYRRLRGEDQFVPLIKKQVKYRPNAGRPTALYQCAELPDDPRVPAHLRGGLVWFRHDNDGPEPDPDLNRAEVLRTVCETDRDEWCDLYYDRPGSESDNARDQNSLPSRRAPSLGARSQQIDLICLEMAHHLDAEHAYQTRTATPGAKAPPPPAVRRAA